MEEHDSNPKEETKKWDRERKACSLVFTTMLIQVDEGVRVVGGNEGIRLDPSSYGSSGQTQLPLRPYSEVSLRPKRIPQRIQGVAWPLSLSKFQLPASSFQIGFSRRSLNNLQGTREPWLVCPCGMGIVGNNPSVLASLPRRTRYSKTIFSFLSFQGRRSESCAHLRDIIVVERGRRIILGVSVFHFCTSVWERSKVRSGS